MPDAAQLLARVGADTAEGAAGLRRISGEFNATSEQAQKTVATVNGLTERLNFQSRELGLLQNSLDQAKSKYGEDSEQVQRLQLQIDKLTSSMRENEGQLTQAQQGLGRLKEQGSASGQAAALFQEVWTGALREVGSLAVQALQSAVGAIEQFAEAGVQTAATNEQVVGSYQTMIAAGLRQADTSLTQAQALSQASGQAQELLQWTKELAINSPFDTEGVAKALQTAQAYGFSADEAKRLTQAGADFVAGSGRNVEAMNSIELALGQIQAKGKLSGQEVLQLVNAGLPVTQILADAFGKSTAEVQKLQEQGLIPARQAIEAITGYMESNFAGAAQRMSGSISGLENSLSDLYKQAAADVLTPAIREAQPYVKELVDTLQSPEAKAQIDALGQTLGDVASTVIPVALSAGKELGGALAEIGTQGKALIVSVEDLAAANKPLFDYISQTALPTTLQLATAFGGSLVHGLSLATEVTAEVYGPVERLGALLERYPGVLAAIEGPLAQVQQGFTQYDQALQPYHQQLLATTQAQLDAQPAYQASAAALQALGNASEDTRNKLAPYHDSLERERQLVADLQRQLQDKQNVGLISQDEVDKEQAAITAHLNNIQALTNALTQKQAAETQSSAYGGYVAAEQAKTEAVQARVDAEKQAAEKLAPLAEAGTQAAQRLADSQTQYQAAEQERQRAHGEKLTQLINTRNADIKKADDAFNLDRQTALAASTKQIEAIYDTHQRKLDELDAAEVQRKEKSEGELTSRLEAIQTQRNALATQAAHEREIAEREYGEKVTAAQTQESERALGAEREFNQKLADLQTQRNAIGEQANQARIASEAGYQAKYSELQSQGAADYEKYQQELGGLQEKYNSDTYERELNLGYKIEDLQRSFAQRQSDLTRNAQRQQQDRADDHADRISDLEEQKSQATDIKTSDRIQKEIDKENEKYTKQRDRAQRDLQQKQDDLQRDLAQQEAAARTDEERAQQKAQRDLDRTRQDVERKRIVQVAGYEQQLQDLREHHAAELAAIDTRQREELAKLDTTAQRERDDYGQREAVAQRHYQQTLTDLHTNYEEQLGDAEWKREQEKLKLDQGVKDARDAFAQREKDAKDHYAGELAKINDAYQLEDAKARDSYRTKYNDLKKHHDDALKAVNDRLTTQLEAEVTAYTKSEQAAKTSYERQQKDLDQALGKQLFAYIEQQKALGQLGKDGDANIQEAKRREQIIGERYGYAPDQQQRAFSSQLDSFLRSAPPTLPAGAAAGAGAAGGGVHLGGITINGNLLTDQTLQDAVIAALNQAARQNGGSLQLGTLTIGGPS